MSNTPNSIVEFSDAEIANTTLELDGLVNNVNTANNSTTNSNTNSPKKLHNGNNHLINGDPGSIILSSVELAIGNNNSLSNSSTALNQPLRHASLAVVSTSQHLLQPTQQQQQQQQNKLEPLFSRSNTAPPYIKSGETPTPYTSTINKVTPATKGTPPPRQFVPFKRQESMVSMMNPGKNYLTRKATNSRIERPTFWDVLKSCVRLVVFLTCTAFVALVPAVGWAFFDCFYKTTGSPILPECEYCDSISEAFTVLSFGIYPFLLLIAIYEYEKVKFLARFNIIYVCVMVGLDAVLYIYLYEFQLFITYFIWIILLVYNGWKFSSRFGLEKSYVLFFSASFLLEAVFLLINDYTIIPSFIDNDDVIWRLFLRNIVHPVFYSILILWTRFSAKRLHSDRAVVLTLAPLFFKAFFGRIFTSEFGSYDMLVLNSSLSVILDIALRLIHWNRHRVFKKLKAKYPHIWKDRGILKWLFDSPEGDVFYGQFLNYEKSQEVIGIVLSLFLHFINCVYMTTYNEIPVLVYSLLVQLAIELTGQVIISMLEYYFDVPVINSTKHFREFMPIFTFSTLMGAMFCSVRGYLIISGQWWDT